MKVLLSSNNPHKLREIAQIVKPFGIELVLPADLGLHYDVDETGTTFEENSRLKAEAGVKLSGLPSIADDSGLSVDALDGAPGVYSARFGGSHDESDEFRNDYLLEKLKDVPDNKRTARYVCVITLMWPDGSTLAARGECEGIIIRERHGTNGFGYDPLFYVPSEGCTMAEITPEHKNEISHRGIALQKLAALLKEKL